MRKLVIEFELTPQYPSTRTDEITGDEIRHALCCVTHSEFQDVIDGGESLDVHVGRDWCGKIRVEARDAH